MSGVIDLFASQSQPTVLFVVENANFRHSVLRDQVNEKANQKLFGWQDVNQKLALLVVQLVPGRVIHVGANSGQGKGACHSRHTRARRSRIEKDVKVASVANCLAQAALVDGARDLDECHIDLRDCCVDRLIDCALNPVSRCRAASAVCESCEEWNEKERRKSCEAKFGLQKSIRALDHFAFSL